MRPHRLLEVYLQSVEAALLALRGAYVESYVEELLTPLRANLRVRVRFDGGRLLEISEAVFVEGDILKPLDYRYHCQDGANRLADWGGGSAMPRLAAVHEAGRPGRQQSMRLWTSRAWRLPGAPDPELPH